MRRTVWIMAERARTAFRASIAVLDDEENMGKILSKLLELEGYHVRVFTRHEPFLAYIGEHEPDLVLSDIRMPGMSGIGVLKEIRRREHTCQVVMMTAFGTIDGAIECVKAGAFDYITKPFKTDELLLTIGKALENKRLREVNKALSTAYNQAGGALDRPLLGHSPAMQRVRALIERVAPSDSAVLVTGESGTGKELAARALHEQSRRKAGRFVAINCASIPENLIESELFGHERGAFTGAADTKVGLVELASGGTLFLDEIGELPVMLQAKLLRVLQEKELTRVGGVASIAVDIRIVAATNRDLQQAIREKTFREDLFYRLNVISVEMPPLRERREDIPVLANHFLELKRTQHGRPGLYFSEAVSDLLRGLSWPGNVRELENTVERLVVLADSDAITTDLLPAEMRDRPGSSSSTGISKLALSAQALVEGASDFRTARDQFEREYLEALLRDSLGSVSGAARKAGMSRRSLYDKIEKLGIDLDRIQGGGTR